MKSEAAVRIRATTRTDTEAILQVLRRNGAGDIDKDVWRSTWEAYPLAAEFEGIPTGWVLETEDGSIVGTLDNVHTLYEWEGRRLKGVVAAGWAVDTEYRGKSMQLMTTFFRQKGIDLWLNVSASPAAAQVLTAMRIPRIPIPDYGTPCFWAVRPRAFARAALLKRSIGGAAVLAWPAGLILLVRDVCRSSGRGRIASQVRRLTAFDDRFDQGLGTTKTRIRAVRNKAVLEWRFRAELRAGRVAIVAAERGSTLLGYAVLLRRDGSELEMELYDVADLQALGDDPATFRDLLLGSIRIAREEGVDALKFMSGTPVKRAQADALRPYSYQLPFWQQYFKTASPELNAGLATAEAWDFSLFDTY